jgi:hypothetical protein
MTNTKYKTSRVAGRNLKVGTVCYHGGEIVSLKPRQGVAYEVTFRDGRIRQFGFSERVRIYPNL